MLNRRELLATTAAFAALPKFAFAADRIAPDPETVKLDGLMTAFMQENLRQGPEGATILGLDTEANADLRSKLHDESVAGIAVAKALNLEQLRRLTTVDPVQLHGVARVNYETLLYTVQSRAQVAAFDFGGTSFGPSPYVVSQLTGAYQSVPDFLDTKHRIENAADADAYLSRLEAFAGLLDDNTARMKHDATLGVVPPDFLLDTALAQLKATRTTADKSLLVMSVASGVQRRKVFPIVTSRAQTRSTTRRSGRRSTVRLRRRHRCGNTPRMTPACGSSKTAKASTRQRCASRPRLQSPPTKSISSGLTRRKNFPPASIRC